MQTASTPAAPQNASHKAMLWIVFAGFFMQALDTTIVNTALPSMARSLGEKPLDLKSVVVAYTLTMAMLTPASGWLADKFGTRRVYFSAILIFVLGSVFCAMAHTLPQLVIARVLQGIGGSMLLPIGRLAVLRNIPGEQYIAALAFVSVAGQVGPLLGPALGGWLVQDVSWHWIFLINVPVGFVGLFAVRRYLPQDAVRAVAPFDWLGCGLLSLCMVAFSLALENGARSPWSVVLIAVSIVSALLYVPHARRRVAPLFQLALFREPNFSIGLIGNLFCRIGSGAVPFLLPLLFQLQLGYSPFHSGLLLLPIAVAGMLAKRWVVPLVNRFGYDVFLQVNTWVVGVSIASFAAMSPGWPLVLSIVQLSVFGWANSMQFAAMNSITLKGLSHQDAGSGNSLFSMVQMLAIGLGVSIGGGLVSLFSVKLGVAAPAYRLAFFTMGVVTVFSAWIFRKLDGKPMPVRAKNVEAEAVQAR
ncbi:multidrug transporter subunit MdtD [Ralstonia sp. CHL-2022]|uniref:Multidrug transporter subunit MdtD n=1 Tax=Ralstonia mojiangensis TaxID=2953895 RepID=A0ABT2LCB6_9RALS|nr:multidrug transporter subunit MdtD [Ralstonia mojiangensis]MCT7298099.1 multidrug transporter subunit MdtD [Ralstonia mojiangensis]MCT7312438.1 multidrug transporter subunit MdtD [Ralstonia mojiangensis]MCT7327048.1 multidrug transporter subunit MdtD [Ralstonia mojiangensis]